jgi:hypothetical protein
MASCVKCNKQVGCGCNVNKEGLCAVCAEEKRKSEALNPKPPVVNKPFFH